MSSESEIRSRYLALALDARKLIDALIAFVDQEKRNQELEQSLQQVIASLQPVGEKKDLFSPDRSRLAFSEYYEQVRTVEDALKPAERGQIVEKLQSIRSQHTDFQKQKEDAYDAIRLLSAIESRALYYYRPQP